MRKFSFTLAMLAAGSVVLVYGKNKRPNILFVIADDQSYPYASAYGERMVNTPAFDYVASHGVLFHNAYATSPGSSPSRASILTGCFPWQIEEAGTHASSFPSRFICYTDVLDSAGYRVGYTGKGWAPGDWKVSGRPHNPAGEAYNDIRLTPPYPGISENDYSANFSAFLDANGTEEPFCFWYGANEPHRPYTIGAWKKDGRDTSLVKVPDYLPDASDVKIDLANYALEIEWFDSHLGKMIKELETRGLLENTLIIVTADNGMAFPHAKANCYDAGIHVPLAICWGDNIKHKEEQTMVSLVDIFPTLLDAAQVTSFKKRLSGHSLFPLLGLTEGIYNSGAIYSGRERHSCARYANYGYPIRTIVKDGYQLIHNFHPERMPAGDPLAIGETDPLNGYGDIDGGPTKRLLINKREDDYFRRYFRAAVSLRPEYELYHLTTDAACMHNLASNPDYADKLAELKACLSDKLIATADSRVVGNNPEVWETYPRLVGAMKEFPEHVPNAFSLSEVTVQAGEQNVPLAISMSNDMDVTAVSFDIVLPSGMLLATMDGVVTLDLNQERTSKERHDVAKVEPLESGHYRVNISSTENRRFTGSEGKICQLYLNISGNLKTGVHKVELKNITMRDESALEVSPADVFCDVTISLVESMAQQVFNEDNTAQYYSIEGKQLSSPQRGINLVKFSNGESKLTINN